MKSRKKRWIALLALALAACMAGGLTLAYNTVQKSVTNRFEMTYSENGLQAMLTEPDWDGIIAYEYGEGGMLYPIYAYQPDGSAVYGYEGGDPSRPITDRSKASQGERPKNGKTYGDTLARHLLPGIQIPKNPMITNTSTTEEWVAMKVTFIYPSGHSKAGQPLSLVDYMQVMDILELDYNTAAWDLVEENGPSLVFYYRSILAKAAAMGSAGGETQPLFQAVSVKNRAANAQVERVQALGGFVIYLEGFAAQGAQAATYSEFRSWGVSGGVQFDYTPSESNPASYDADGIVARP